MNKYFKRAAQLKDELTRIRRHIHQNPETGLELNETKVFVKKELSAIGLDAKDVGKSGLTVLIEGEKSGKVFLLRADMDALPMREENDLPFRSQTDKAHTCGHDLHTAMLLGAARILHENRKDIHGAVKLMFQPAEEIFKGAADMIENGILENPKVDAAMAIHTGLEEEVGSFGYYLGNISTSCDNFRIDITGKGGHGAYPHTTIDPIQAGVSIYQNFSALVSREVAPEETVTLTFGEFSSGSSSNVIPEKARLQGTLRTYNPEIRKTLKNRMKEIIEAAEKMHRVKIDYDFFSGTPSVYSAPAFTEEIVNVLKEANENLKAVGDTRIMASEDMALIAEKVPTAFFMLNCRVGGNTASHHNPAVLFDEDALPLGCAMHVSAAIGYLKAHS